MTSLPRCARRTRWISQLHSDVDANAAILSPPTDRSAITHCAHRTLPSTAPVKSCSNSDSSEDLQCVDLQYHKYASTGLTTTPQNGESLPSQGTLNDCTSWTDHGGAWVHDFDNACGKSLASPLTSFTYQSPSNIGWRLPMAYHCTVPPCHAALLWEAALLHHIPSHCMCVMRVCLRAGDGGVRCAHAHEL